jgi:hypothetical protein
MEMAVDDTDLDQALAEHGLQDTADDATVVSGSKTGSRPPSPNVSNIPTKQEIVLKWVFQPTDPSVQVKDIRTAHGNIMEIMRDQHPGQIVVMNSYNKIAQSTEILDVNNHTKMFTVHTKQTPRSRTSTTYEMYHRIQTTVPLHVLRRHPDVVKRLKAGNVRVAQHYWREDEKDVKDLGWFVTYNPKHSLQEQMTRNIRLAIAAGARCSDKRIPQFVCHQTSVSALFNRHRVATHAYGIQCREKDTKLLMKQLQKTYENSDKFLFYSSKHHHPTEYVKAILTQNQYLDNSRVVAIAGIPPAGMWSFEAYLQAKEHRILQVWVTKSTNTEGRYNLETTASNMRPVARFLNNNLERIYNEFLADPSTPDAARLADDMPMPYMASRISRLQDDGSDGSDDDGMSSSFASVGTGFYSTCSISLSEYDIPKESPPTVLPAVLNQHPPKPMTYIDALKRPTTPQLSDLTSNQQGGEEGASTNRRIEELEKQLAQLMEDKTKMQIELAIAQHRAHGYGHIFPKVAAPPKNIPRFDDISSPGDAAPPPVPVPPVAIPPPPPAPPHILQASPNQEPPATTVLPPGLQQACETMIQEIMTKQFEQMQQMFMHQMLGAYSGTAPPGRPHEPSNPPIFATQPQQQDPASSVGIAQGSHDGLMHSPFERQDTAGQQSRRSSIESPQHLRPLKRSDQKRTPVKNKDTDMIPRHIWTDEEDGEPPTNN